MQEGGGSECTRRECVCVGGGGGLVSEGGGVRGVLKAGLTGGG